MVSWIDVKICHEGELSFPSETIDRVFPRATKLAIIGFTQNSICHDELTLGIAPERWRKYGKVDAAMISDKRAKLMRS